MRVPFPTYCTTTKNNDSSPSGWETLVTKHTRELNDLLGAYDDLPECTDEMSSTQVASLVNRMHDFHHGPSIGAKDEAHCRTARI